MTYTDLINTRDLETLSAIPSPTKAEENQEAILKVHVADEKFISPEDKILAERLGNSAKEALKEAMNMYNRFSMSSLFESDAITISTKNAASARLKPVVNRKFLFDVDSNSAAKGTAITKRSSNMIESHRSDQELELQNLDLNLKIAFSGNQARPSSKLQHLKSLVSQGKVGSRVSYITREKIEESINLKNMKEQA